MSNRRLFSRIAIVALLASFLFILRELVEQVVSYVDKSAELARKKTDYFAICLLVKDEDNIVEWVDYHLALGTSKIYLHDHNNDTTILSGVLKPYIDKNQVVYYPMPPARKYPRGNRNITAQLIVFSRCLQLYRRHHFFMGFIDSDEYIVLGDKSYKNIPSVLKKYEGFGGLTLNWKIFGSSGHITKPSGGVKANYHKCYSDVHVKTIVNTQYVLKDQNQPHSFSYKKGYYAVDTSKQLVNGPRNPPDLNSVYHPFRNKTLLASQSGPYVPIVATNIPSYLYSTMYINHYHTKSREEYIRKANRGRFSDTPFSMEYFDSVNSIATENCSILSL